MKNAIEARRPEAYTAKPDEDLDSPDAEVCIYVCISVHPKKVSKNQCKLRKLSKSPQVQFFNMENEKIVRFCL